MKNSNNYGILFKQSYSAQGKHLNHHTSKHPSYYTPNPIQNRNSIMVPTDCPECPRPTVGGQRTCICQQLGQMHSGLGNTEGLNTTMKHQDHFGSVIEASVSENEFKGFYEVDTGPTDEYSSSNYGGDYDSDSDSSFVFVARYPWSNYGTNWGLSQSDFGSSSSSYDSSPGSSEVCNSDDDGCDSDNGANSKPDMECQSDYGTAPDFPETNSHYTLSYSSSFWSANEYNSNDQDPDAISDLDVDGDGGPIPKATMNRTQSLSSGSRCS